MSDTPERLTAKEIYDEIVKRNLYVFSAKKTHWVLLTVKFEDELMDVPAVEV